MAGKSRAAPVDASLIAVLPAAAVITAGPWDNGGVDLLHVNEAFCALTGYSASELAGRNLRRLHGPRTDLTGWRFSRQEAEAGTGEGWLYRKNGTAFFAHWSFRPLMRRAAGPMIVLFHDHTENWRQREALLRSQKLDTVGLLAIGVAHDFNNLISVINGNCEILAPKVAGRSAVMKNLNEIHLSGLKAAAIARQLLEFGRRPSVDAVVINFNTLIREIAGIIRRVCSNRIELELRLSSDLGNARINPTHFQQVLLNLCFNARDAMPRGGTLVIRTANHALSDPPADGSRPAPLPGNYVMLEVRDQGEGIAPEALDRIFEPFYTTKAHGSGLGLAISQSIVRQAHGHITVRSRPGEGTGFMVFLPETAEPEEPSLATLEHLPATAGTESILLIEPEEPLRRMIAGILVTDGYTVIDAATPEEAARRGARPQLVIMDTGSRAARSLLTRLRAANPAMRLIGIGVRPPASARLATAHLPKPFALSALVQCIRALLDADAK